MRLAVQGAWVGDNLRRLGNGAFYHLAYPTHQVDSRLLERLRTGTPNYGRVEIYVLRENRGLKIADGELIAVHWFPEFIRIHFMILHVYVDDLGEEIHWENARYYVTSHT